MNNNTEDSRISHCGDSSPHYLARGEALIVQGGRPLGRDAHFHIAEGLPGRVQEHIAGDTESKAQLQKVET